MDLNINTLLVSLPKSEPSTSELPVDARARLKDSRVVCSPSSKWKFRFIHPIPLILPSGNQTWLARKSLRSEGFIAK